MKNLLQYLSRGLSRIVFPNVCACCGCENTQQQRQLCSFCLQSRFEDANPDNEQVSSDSLLPAGVIAQQALWQFDKGGDLQHLLHQLKYERLTTIGVDLGRRLGQRIRETPRLNSLLSKEDAIILPVPLHYKKYRYRGFNQAFKLAQGFQKEWEEIPICDVKDVVRTKNTASQTGFSLQRRLQNMENAFEVRNQAAVQDKLVVIVDDVFTTGATTFELSASVLAAGARSTIILTIAQA